MQISFAGLINSFNTIRLQDSSSVGSADNDVTGTVKDLPKITSNVWSGFIPSDGIYWSGKFNVRVCSLLTCRTSIDMVSDTHRLDCYFITTPALNNTDRFGNNCYFENFDDLPDRVKKLYIYFIPLDI